MVALMDPMASAVGWFAAYRAASMTIVDLHTDGASVECRCNATRTVVGRKAIADYWRRCFCERPARHLLDLQTCADAIVVSYSVADDRIVHATLDFAPNGKIKRIRCGAAEPLTSLPARDEYRWSLKCPVCGAVGIACVSEDALPEPGNINFRVDQVSDRFCLIRSGSSAIETEIICTKCKTVV